MHAVTVCPFINTYVSVSVHVRAYIFMIVHAGPGADPLRLLAREWGAWGEQDSR